MMISMRSGVVGGRRGITGKQGAVAALIASGAAWGTSVPFSKVALGWLAPGWLTVARFGLAAVVLLIIAGRSGTLRGSLRLPVLASGVLGYGMSVVIQNAGVQRTSVTHASLIIGGVGFIAGGQGHGATPAGDLLVLLSTMLSAAVTVAQGRLLVGRDPIALTAVLFLGASLAALPFAASEGLPAAPASAAVVLATAGVTICGTLIPFSLFAFGQKRVSAELAGAFLNLEPLVGAMIGIVAFGDPAGARQVAGGVAIIAGIALSTLPLLPPGRATRSPGGTPPDPLARTPRPAGRRPLRPTAG